MLSTTTAHRRATSTLARSVTFIVTCTVTYLFHVFRWSKFSTVRHLTRGIQRHVLCVGEWSSLIVLPVLWSTMSFWGLSRQTDNANHPNGAPRLYFLIAIGLWPHFVTLAYNFRDAINVSLSYISSGVERVPTHGGPVNYGLGCVSVARHHAAVHDRRKRSFDPSLPSYIKL